MKNRVMPSEPKSEKEYSIESMIKSHVNDHLVKSGKMDEMKKEIQKTMKKCMGPMK